MNRPAGEARRSWGERDTCRGRAATCPRSCVVVQSAEPSSMLCQRVEGARGRRESTRRHMPLGALRTHHPTIPPRTGTLQYFFFSARLDSSQTESVRTRRIHLVLAPHGRHGKIHGCFFLASQSRVTRFTFLTFCFDMALIVLHRNRLHSSKGRKKSH